MMTRSLILLHNLVFLCRLWERIGSDSRQAILGGAVYFVFSWRNL
jgi:hypothetical protein